jgi:hypothetical protein
MVVVFKNNNFKIPSVAAILKMAASTNSNLNGGGSHIKIGGFGGYSNLKLK